MPTEEQHSEIYEFADFRLEVAERRLFRAGQPLVVHSKALDVLVVLVRHHGKLLTKQELMNLVWPGLAVEEANLANKISYLRKMLESGNPEDSMIETVPRHGYRFRGTVTVRSPQPAQVVIERFTVTEIVTEEVDTQRETPAKGFPVIELTAASQPTPTALPLLEVALFPTPQPIAIKSVPRFSRLHLGWLASTGGAVVLTGILIAWFSIKTPGPPLPPPRIIPLTNQAGEKTHPAFSPDGKFLAYTWDRRETENHDIYITRIGDLTPKQITDSPVKEFRPVWSPDGKALAFLRGSGTTLELITKSIESGVERSFGTVAGGLSWSSDGKYLAIQELRQGETQTGITLLEVGTGRRHPLTQAQPPWNDMRPVFSPDATQLAFIRKINEHGDIWVIPAKGGKPRKITNDKAIMDSLAWLPTGQEIIYSSSRAGESGVWRISLKGGEPQGVTPIHGQCDDLAVDPTGTRIAYHQRTASSNLWCLKRSSAEAPWPATNLNAATPLTTSTRNIDSPAFSPDGTRLAFSSNETGSAEIWTSDTDGTGATRLTFFNQDIAGTPHWSPDGQTIVFDGGIGGTKQVYLMNAQGGVPKPVTDPATTNNLATWSHDGKWIYFCSLRTGTRQIWKMPATGGPEIQVTHNGGWECAESWDGKKLYYTKDKAVAGIWQLDLTTGSETPIPELSHAGKHRYWAVAADGIYFAALNEAQIWTINFFDFKSRSSKEVFNLHGPMLRGPAGLAVSPDQTKLVFVQKDQFGSDVLMVENFR